MCNVCFVFHVGMCVNEWVSLSASQYIVGNQRQESINVLSASAFKCYQNNKDMKEENETNNKAESNVLDLELVFTLKQSEWEIVKIHI